MNYEKEKKYVGGKSYNTSREGERRSDNRRVGGGRSHEGESRFGQRSSSAPRREGGSRFDSRNDRGEGKAHFGNRDDHRGATSRFAGRNDRSEGTSRFSNRGERGEGGNAFNHRNDRGNGGTRFGNRDDRRPNNGEERSENRSYRPSYGNGGESSNRPWKKAESSGEHRSFSRGGQSSQSKPWRKEGNSFGGSQRRFGSSEDRSQRFSRPQRRSDDYDPNAKYSNKKRVEYKEASIDPNALVRLNKFLANSGICSRREADEYITAGVVSVNGKPVTELGTKIKRTDEVKFHEQPVKVESKVYVLLNKPKNCVTTSEDPQNRHTVMDLVAKACPERIYPVGRLDRNTMGVLLLTNDGDMASKLTHPKYLKKKIYHVHLDKKVSHADLETLVSGFELEDGEIHADAASYVDEHDRSQVGLEIHSGRNRIVRRMFEHLGYKVSKLDRVYFSGLTKKNLRRGDWRFLTEAEVNFLRMGSYE